MFKIVCFLLAITLVVETDCNPLTKQKIWRDDQELFQNDDTPPQLLYKFIETNLNFVDAENECHKWGGELATISSADMNKFIDDELKKRIILHAWIGYNDRDVEGSFRWPLPSSSSLITDYTNWGPDEPNGDHGANCAEIITGYAHGREWNGKWNDTPCTVKQPSVCQKRVVNPCEIAGCSYQCENRGGVAVCLCPIGYKLDGGKKKCIKANIGQCRDVSSLCRYFFSAFSNSKWAETCKNTLWYKENCKHSCGLCTTGGGSESNTGSCRESVKCLPILSKYSSRGREYRCKYDPMDHFMFYCQKSCGLCTTGGGGSG